MDIRNTIKGLENMDGQTGKMKDTAKVVMDKMKSVTEKMGKIQKIEPIGAKSGQEFNDLDKGTAFGKKVVGLCVRSGYILDGIQVLYEGDQKGDMHGSKTGGGLQIISLDEDDELSCIEANYGIRFGGPEGAVSNLIIKTKNGRTFGPYGDGRSASKIHLEVPEGCEFIGLCGKQSTDGNGGLVSALGLIYCSK